MKIKNNNKVQRSCQLSINQNIQTKTQKCLFLFFFFFKVTSSCGTHSIFYATGGLSKQLWLGILHLGGVENLLALHLVQMQEPAEPHGGWKERNMKTWAWQNIAQRARYYSVPIAFTQSSCQGCVRIGLVMDCVYVCVWREKFSELVADYMGGWGGILNSFAVQAGARWQWRLWWSRCERNKWGTEKQGKTGQFYQTETRPKSWPRHGELVKKTTS